MLDNVEMEAKHIAKIIGKNMIQYICPEVHP